MHYRHLGEQLQDTALEPFLSHLLPVIQESMSAARWGDLPGWQAALSALPEITPGRIDLLHGVTIGDHRDPGVDDAVLLKTQLQALIPWRKGPFSIFGIELDTEWRSDWKWDRLIPHISPLAGRTVLDVGCGNGYHCLRMAGAGATRVIGIDPSPRFVVQFYMLKKYLGNLPVDILPVGIEALPAGTSVFDTTFSMGVFYHRRSPMDHLRELRDTLKPGGELVLETLVVEGEVGTVLVPEGRYAMMNNVWFIPSSATLLVWLRKAGFNDPRVVDETVTTTEEQRRTEWMRFHSLAEFLNPRDSRLTIEGHPAPRRATLVATKPLK